MTGSQGCTEITIPAQAHHRSTVRSDRRSPGLVARLTRENEWTR